MLVNYIMSMLAILIGSTIGIIIFLIWVLPFLNSLMY